MAKYLQKVLNLPEPIFSDGLARLEKATGNSGVDVRLIADMTEKAHAIMRKMGLDTRDTTDHELYLALNALIRRKDSEELLADADFVLYIINDKVISFNLIDVIENAHHEMPLSKNIISHGQRSLRGELVGRYLDHARTDEVTAREMAKHIGLLPESDAWYTGDKHNHQKAGELQK
jgi:hypothetical protein